MIKARHAMGLGVREQIVELVEQLLGPGVANPARAAHVGDAVGRREAKHLASRGMEMSRLTHRGSQSHQTVESHRH
jgi:hypothetical protein